MSLPPPEGFLSCVDGPPPLPFAIRYIHLHMINGYNQRQNPTNINKYIADHGKNNKILSINKEEIKESICRLVRKTINITQPMIIKECQKLRRCDRKTAIKYLKELEEDGKIKCDAIGKKIVWVPIESRSPKEIKKEFYELTEKIRNLTYEKEKEFDVIEPVVNQDLIKIFEGIVWDLQYYLNRPGITQRLIDYGYGEMIIAEQRIEKKFEERENEIRDEVWALLNRILRRYGGIRNIFDAHPVTIDGKEYTTKEVSEMLSMYCEDFLELCTDMELDKSDELLGKKIEKLKEKYPYLV